MRKIRFRAGLTKWTGAQGDFLRLAPVYAPNFGENTAYTFSGFVIRSVSLVNSGIASACAIGDKALELLIILNSGQYSPFVSNERAH